MDNVLISIIIPAFNSEKNAAGCLKSVMAQTHTNLEIIVVDDGSKDNTWEIINSFAKQDSRIIPVHKENGGVTSARLAGIERATGEYIGFVDSDDYVEPDMFELLLNNALEYDAEISHCGYQMVFPSGRTKYFYDTKRIIEECNPTFDLLSGDFVEPALVNKIFKQDLFSELISSDRIDTGIKMHEDLLMNFYLFRRAKRVVFQDVCKYHYLVHKNYAANAQLKEHHLLDPLRVARIIINEVIQEPSLYVVATQRLIVLLIALATRPLREKRDLIKPHRKNARRELRGMIWKILFGHYSISLKIKALWASVWPASYMWVHELYLRKTGLDKIYSLED